MVTAHRPGDPQHADAFSNATPQHDAKAHDDSRSWFFVQNVWMSNNLGPERFFVFLGPERFYNKR